VKSADRVTVRARISRQALANGAQQAKEKTAQALTRCDRRSPESGQKASAQAKAKAARNIAQGPDYFKQRVMQKSFQAKGRDRFFP
jgi:hypothetical protein